MASIHMVSQEIDATTDDRFSDVSRDEIRKGLLEEGGSWVDFGVGLVLGFLLHVVIFIYVIDK